MSHKLVSLYIGEGEYYTRTDADNVIAEKDKEIAELKEQVHEYAQGLYVLQARAEKEVRHQKYKRCLAMTRFCEERYNYLNCLENWQMTDKEYRQSIGNYWDRWHNRWLELAEKFKDKEA